MGIGFGKSWHRNHVEMLHTLMMTQDVPLTLPAMTSLPAGFSEGRDSPATHQRSTLREQEHQSPAIVVVAESLMTNGQLSLVMQKIHATAACEILLGCSLPVIIDSSTNALPECTTPSAGILAPGST